MSPKRIRAWNIPPYVHVLVGKRKYRLSPIMKKHLIKIIKSILMGADRTDTSKFVVKSSPILVYIFISNKS